MSWEIVPINSASQKYLSIEKFDALGLSNQTLHPYQDIQWLLAEKEFDVNLYCCTFLDSEDNVGYCILRKQRRPVRLLFGEFTVYQHAIDRFELWSAPIVKSKSDGRELSIHEEFLESIDELLVGGGALSIEGLPHATPFYRCVMENASQRLCIQLGPPFMHQSIKFPRTFDVYLQQMSKRSRSSVQYSQRKLNREFRVELFECNSSAHVEIFLDEAISISRKTYQWNLLGLGLRDRIGLKGSLLKWDRNAELLSFILRCDGKPVAFMLGYIHRSCYYYIDVGYDPDWSSFSPGSVLQFAVIERLYKLEHPIETFDFSTGYGEHKGRFGNTEQEEVNMLVLSATVKNRVFVFAYNSVEFISSVTVSLLDKVGVKKRLKKIIRRFS